MGVSIVHYNDVIMGLVASQTTSLTVVYSTVYSGADQRQHQSSASLAFVRGIHRGPVNSAHKWPVTRKIFPFDDVIMEYTVLFLQLVTPHCSWKLVITITRWTFKLRPPSVLMTLWLFHFTPGILLWCAPMFSRVDQWWSPMCTVTTTQSPCVILKCMGSKVWY